MDFFRDIDYLAAGHADQVVVTARVGIVTLSFGVDGKFSEYPGLRKRMDGIINSSKRHRLIFYRYRPKYVFR